MRSAAHQRHRRPGPRSADSRCKGAPRRPRARSPVSADQLEWWGFSLPPCRRRPLDAIQPSPKPYSCSQHVRLLQNADKRTLTVDRRAGRGLILAITSSTALPHSAMPAPIRVRIGPGPDIKVRSHLQHARERLMVTGASPLPRLHLCSFNGCSCNVRSPVHFCGKLQCAVAEPSLMHILYQLCSCRSYRDPRAWQERHS